MFGMFAANIFDAKIVNTEGKADWVSVMEEEASCMFGRVVPECCKVSNEAELCNEASLGWAVHSLLPDLNHDKTIVNEGSKVVLLHDALWDGQNGNPHVLACSMPLGC
jgi:hypothetical protein